MSNPLETKTPREILAGIIRRSKTKLPEGHDVALADSICNALDRQGIVLAGIDEVLDPPDEHLQILKQMRTRVRESVIDKETPPRDLASLSRRLQDVSQEIHSIEERVRADAKSRPIGSGNTNGSTSDPAGAAKSGPLNI